MTSITSWIRLEPRARDPEMRPGVEARLHDPAWLLARQWQLGEFQGEDAGSAATVRVRYDTGLPSTLVGRDGVARAYDPDALPLEAAVQAAPPRERGPGMPPLRDRADSGRQLLRELRGEQPIRKLVLARYSLAVTPAERAQLDERDLALLGVVAGRLPDGMAVADAVRADLQRGTLPADWNVPRGQQGPAVVALRRWLSWHDTLWLEPALPAAWDADRMEHRFDVQIDVPGQPLVLACPEHAGGSLDWHAFDLKRLVLPPGIDPAQVTTCLPSPVRYHGMPSPRYWELEDGSLSWSAIDAARDDVARLLFVDFALTGSDDWLVVPIAVPLGSLTVVRSVVVTDTFGVRTLIRTTRELDGGDSPWKMFTMSAAPNQGIACLHVPASAAPLDARPIEEVCFAHDEQANLVWATETSVARADGAGRRPPVPAAPPAPPAPSAAGLTYHVGTAPPPGYAPLVLAHRDQGPVLARATIGQTRPATSILDGASAVPTEEIPRHGLRAARGYRWARWLRGTSLAWNARAKTAGARTDAPGLLFDILRSAEESDVPAPAMTPAPMTPAPATPAESIDRKDKGPPHDRGRRGRPWR